VSSRPLLVFITMVVFTAAELTAAAPRPAPTKQTPAKKRQRVVSDLSGFELLDAAKLQDKPVVAGATRGIGGPRPPVLLAPHLAKLHGAGPVFAWRHDGERYAFVLSDELGQDVHSAEVTGHNYAWPAAAPRLADGKTYFWSVRPVSGSLMALASMAAVVVVTSAERQAIDRSLTEAIAADPYQEGLARAQVLVDTRVWYDALGAYNDIIARFPKRPEAYERRGNLFAQLAVTQEQAEEDFARADVLSGK
jgi:hypothetical protein